MTLMMGKLYAALKAVNAPETEAREAAEEAASVLNLVDNLDRGIRRLEWMVAGILAVALAVAARLFLHG
jgi:hypothetical protein